MATITDKIIIKILADNKQARKTFEEMDFNLKKIGKSATKIGKDMSLKLTAPLLLLGGIAAKTAIKFESAFTGVRKTVNATEKQFAGLEKQLKSLALEVPLTAEEIFGIAEAAGQLGIERESILPFTKVMADLGATTNLSANEAATSLARFGNITNLAEGDYDKLGSTIVDLGNNLATTEGEIVDMALRLAGAGKTVGLTQAQILALAGGLSSVGIRAEAGGTAFSRVMLEINKNIGTGSEEMKGFAEVSGKSVDEFEKQWKKRPAEALIGFTEGLAKAQTEGKNVSIILENLGFESIRITDSLLRASGSGDLFRNALKLGSEAWKKNTALTKEANLRYGTSASQLKIARNEVAQLAESFGIILAPVLIEIVNFLKPVVKFLKELSPTTKTIIIVIAGLVATIGPLLIAFGLMATAIGIIATASAGVLIAIGGVTAVVIALAAVAIIIIKNWEPIKQFFSDLWKDIGIIFDDALITIQNKISEWEEIGKNIVMGIVEGIKSAGHFLIDAAVDAAKAALRAAKSFLGISSPSAVFAEMGKQMMAGMAKGIQESVGMPQVALAGVTGSIAPIAQTRQNTNDNRQDNRQFTINLNGGNRIGIEQEFALEKTLRNLSRFDASV